MALEYVVGGLLLGSAFVNVLALGSFWVTPSLRTTANRFVINLLIANLISCIILGPSLLLNSVKITVATTVTPTSSNQPTDYLYNQSNWWQTTAEQDFWNATTSVTLVESYLSSTTENPMREEIIEERFSLTEIRCWGLDVAAALGALSVLLVVGDTWCAVTDPLRYHNRLSDLKAVGFIAGVWLIGIIFGIASAFRKDQSLHSGKLNDVDDQLYNTIFSYTYFVVAIMLPFAIVCGMYWRIFSEARESGLRMRQNGSSPLLQSALNLAAVSAATAHTTTSSHQQHVSLQIPPVHEHSTNKELHILLPNKEQQQHQSDVITMRIDKQLNHYNNNILSGSHQQRQQQHCNNLVKTVIKVKDDRQCVKPLLVLNNQVSTPSHCTGTSNKLQTTNINNNNINNRTDNPKINLNLNQTNTSSSNSNNHKFLTSSDRNQNILLTLTTSSSNEQIRRNYSARQLFLVSPDDEDDNFHVPHHRYGLSGGNGELRHANSAPNLPKQTTFDMCHTHHHHHKILPMPTVQVPPRALGYMTSIRHRLSNASSLFKYREESRAARISILVVIMFLVSYLPYGILVIMQGHTEFLHASNQALLAIFTVVLANLSSPFIFAYRNKRVRRGVLRLLGIDKKGNERLNRSGGSTLGCANHYGRTPKSSNVQRSHSSVSSCKYLSPHAAALAAAANGNYILEIEKFPQVHRHYQHKLPSPPEHNDKPESSEREKKSILKRVCDTSRKWGCTCANNSCTQTAESTDV